MFAVLNDEIRRLSRVLEEFDRPFDADPASLQLYKKVCVSVCVCGYAGAVLLLLCVCLSVCLCGYAGAVLLLLSHRFIITRCVHARFMIIHLLSFSNVFWLLYQS